MQESADEEVRRLDSGYCQNEISFGRIDISDTAESARSVFAIDLDGDGDVDVLAASEDDDTVAWFANDGKYPPNFGRQVISRSVDGAVSVFAVDLDGDGDIDVLSAGEDDDTIAWHENDGGSPPLFEKRVINDAAAEAKSVFARDLDGDLDIDVLSASLGDDTIAWYENDGGSPPNFETRIITSSAVGARSVFAIDLDGDLDVDVVSASTQDDTIAWYENDGGISPVFAKHTISTSSGGAFTVFAIDLDGDEDVDVLSANSVDDTITWFQNDGKSSPTFKIGVISDTAIGARSVFASDLDGDGDVDVISASNRDSTVSYYSNDGGYPPEFTEIPISTIVDGARSVFAIDLDDDNDIDVLSASEDGDAISWYENNCELRESKTSYNPSTSPTTKPTSAPLPEPSKQPTEHPSSRSTIPMLPTELAGPSFPPIVMLIPTISSTQQGASSSPSPGPSEQFASIPMWRPSTRPMDSTSSVSSRDYWDMIGAIIGLLGVIIPTIIWWVDKGRDYPRRRCCPQVHFYFFDCCKYEHSDFNTYRGLYEPIAPSIASLLQHVQSLFGSMDSDGSGRVSQRKLLVALREFPELADFFKLPRHIDQEGPSRDAFTRIFRYLADTDNDFDEARWRSRTARFQLTHP